jgi:hypothetical protein
MKSPCAARLFAVVDEWDALTSERPYAPSLVRKKKPSNILENNRANISIRGRLKCSLPSYNCKMKLIKPVKHHSRIVKTVKNEIKTSIFGILRAMQPEECITKKNC